MMKISYSYPETMPAIIQVHYDKVIKDINAIQIKIHKLNGMESFNI
jgi:predicted transcriptional regulator